MEFLKELFEFLREKKKLWLLPLIMIMIFIGGILVLSQGSVVAPLIYTIF
jgi:hypothetical protein